MKIRRGFFAILACLVVSAIILAATTLLAKHDNLVHENEYLPLMNMGSGKCFEPTAPGIPTYVNGLPIQQRTCNHRVILSSETIPIHYYEFQPKGYVAFNDQGWFPCWGCIPRGSVGYFIKNLDTGLCLDARDGARSDWSVVQQWECRDRDHRSMVWYVEPGDFPGMFKVRNFNSDLCLDVRWGSWDEYAQLQQYHCTSNNVAQNFLQQFPPFTSAINLNGTWTDGSTRSAVISLQFPAFIIDMSAFNRPAARGLFIGIYSFIVNFPDDATFTGTIETETSIRWSNGSVWLKN